MSSIPETGTNPGLPLKTSDYLELPDGERVFIKTLNSLQKDDAQDEANWYAREKAEPYRKGNSRYKLLLSDVKQLSQEEQAIHVASQKYIDGTILRFVEDKFPLPMPPERKEGQSDEEFMKAQDKYVKQVETTGDKREEAGKQFFETEKKRCLQIAPNLLLEQTVEVLVSKEYNKSWNRRYASMVILYSTRQEGLITAQRFVDIAEVESLDDEVRQAIIQKYNELDTVKQSEIPTSPEG